MSFNEHEILSRNDLISKLKEIYALYCKTVEIEEEMDDFVPEDNYNRSVVLPLFPGNYRSEEERGIWREKLDHTDDDAIQAAAHAYDLLNHPKKPDDPIIQPPPTAVNTETEKTKKNMGCLTIGAAFIGGVALLSLIGNSDPLGFAVSLILAIGCASLLVFSYLKLSKAKQEDAAALAEMQRQHNQEYAAIMAQHQNNMIAYENSCNNFEITKQEFLKDYVNWRNIYLQHVAEEEEIEEKLEADRLAAVQKIHEEKYTPAIQELEKNNDLISERYLPALNIIIELLISNRADDLKEAVNLYEELVYRERQLQLQREQEEQRRYEEELRRQDEERHHQEEMRFLEDQERQRRYDEEQRQHREDAIRAQEEKDREDMERKAATDAQREAERKCHWCTNWKSCGMRRKPPLNCTGFRPGDTHQI